ncbi:MAG: MBL fold metallo-hydrolase [Pseudomonadota bacterium]
MNWIRGFCLIILAGFLIASCTSAPIYKGETSNHFIDGQFRNSTPMNKGIIELSRLGWGMLTESERWPDWLSIQQSRIQEHRVAEGPVVTFINHATFLIQVNGLNILTDPIWSKRASPFSWAGPKRVHAPAVELTDLPPIDVILISHNHYDHLDSDTLQTIARRDSGPPLILAGLGNAAYFDRLGLPNAIDLDWEQSHTVANVEFVFSETRHRSGRGLTDQMKTLWGAFVIKAPQSTLYFAGDTGYDAHFKATGDKHGPVNLALLPIGAYEPRWFMKDVHVNPREAVQAHLDLRAEKSIGMHFGTFQLTYEQRDQPISDLADALREAGLSEHQFLVPAPGQRFDWPFSARTVPATQK